MCFSKLKSFISISFLLSLSFIIAPQCTADAKTNAKTNYLTFTVETDSASFGIVNHNGNNPNIEYSLDGGKRWITLSNGTLVVLKKGKVDKALLRGVNSEGFSKSDEYTYTNFVMSGRIIASGSVMSLIDGCGESTEIKGERCFAWLFENCISLIQAPQLPATTLTKACYNRMFQYCSNLENAPDLPATSLAKACYSGMFQDCGNLKKAPELPATTLSEFCYSMMFFRCINLEQAPQLPATTLAEGCYEGMFQCCENLRKAPELPATTLAEDCYIGMFSYCTNLTQVPQLPATTLAKGCYRGMFKRCTSLTYAPELPATALINVCYDGMFSECHRLNMIKVGFTSWEMKHTLSDETESENQDEFLDSDIPTPEGPIPPSEMNINVDVKQLNKEKEQTDWSTYNWLSNVATNGIFICPKELPQEFGKDKIPNGWKVVNE